MTEPVKTYKKGNRDSIAEYLYTNQVPYNPNLPTAKLEEIADSFKEGKQLPHQPLAGKTDNDSAFVAAQVQSLTQRVSELEAQPAQSTEKVEELEKKVEELEKKVEELEKKVEELEKKPKESGNTPAQ